MACVPFTFSPTVVHPRATKVVIRLGKRTTTIQGFCSAATFSPNFLLPELCSDKKRREGDEDERMKRDEVEHEG